MLQSSFVTICHYQRYDVNKCIVVDNDSLSSDVSVVIILALPEALIVLEETYFIDIERLSKSLAIYMTVRSTSGWCTSFKKRRLLYNKLSIIILP